MLLREEEGGRKLGEKVTKCGIHNYLLSQQEQEMRGNRNKEKRCFNV